MLNCVLDSEYQNFMTKPTALQIKHRRVKALNFATVQALKFATEPELELSVLPSFYFCFLNLHGARKDLFGGGGGEQCLAKSNKISLSHSDSFPPHGLQPTRLLCPWDSPGKNTGVGCHFLLQGIFPAQGWNPGLPHCRQILYHLSHQGSPKSK